MSARTFIEPVLFIRALVISVRFHSSETFSPALYVCVRFYHPTLLFPRTFFGCLPMDGGRIKKGGRVLKEARKNAVQIAYNFSQSIDFSVKILYNQIDRETVRLKLFRKRRFASKTNCFTGG